MLQSAPAHVARTLLSASVAGKSARATSLLNNFRDGSRADRVSAFADGKAQTLLHRYRRDQLNLQAHIVSRHHHLRARWKFRYARHVRRSQIELRTVSLEEW